MGESDGGMVLFIIFGGELRGLRVRILMGRGLGILMDGFIWDYEV